MSRPDPEAEAIRLLRRYWPTGELPIDPVRLADRLGISVRIAELDPRVSGAIIKHPGENPVIGLQKEDHDSRKRVTCAHQLGHYILCAGKDDFYRVDGRDALSTETSDPDEVFANRFAAALLMPEAAVRRHADEPIYYQASRFGVSAEALGYRLEQLGLRVNEPEPA